MKKAARALLRTGQARRPSYPFHLNRSGKPDSLTNQLGLHVRFGQRAVYSRGFQSKTGDTAKIVVSRCLKRSLANGRELLG
jgi:hypothetical protein